MPTIASHSPLIVSKTAGDRLRSVSNGRVADDVTWPRKVKSRDSWPQYAQSAISWKQLESGDAI